MIPYADVKSDALDRFSSPNALRSRSQIVRGAKRHRDFHGCEDIAIIAPGQVLREYEETQGTPKHTMRTVVAIKDGTYQLTGPGACTPALAGVRKMSPAEALHREVGADGLTRQERGMIDRELFPKRQSATARKKYVRRVRQRSNTVVCDLIAEDGRTLTLSMAATLRHYDVGEQVNRHPACLA